MPGKPWTDDETKRAITLRMAGVDLRDIATVLGRSANSVQDLLYRHGVYLTREQRIEINRRNCGIMNGANRVPPPRPMDINREATMRFELAYCAAAERNGWPIRGYAA